MARMVIHAGFHKTGTSTVQRMLKQNRRLIIPEARFFDHTHMPAVCESARAYSVSRDLLDLLAFTYELGEFLTGLKRKLDRNICISSENLVGNIPGRKGLKSYDAAPILMKAFVHTVGRILPRPPEMIFYFSTRSPQPWLKSCHSQHLRAVRMTKSAAEYAETFAASAELDRIIDMVRLAVVPHKVATASLEDIGDLPLGPVTPILDLLEISQDLRNQMTLVPATNQALPDALSEEFLRINRSDMPWRDLPIAKQAARDRWKWAQEDAAEAQNGQKDAQHD